MRARAAHVVPSAAPLSDVKHRPRAPRGEARSPPPDGNASERARRDERIERLIDHYVRAHYRNLFRRHPYPSAGGDAAMSRDQGRPGPPPDIVAAAERDYREVSHDVAALIAGIRGVRSQHKAELDLFIHVYATIRRAHPTRAAAIAALAVMGLAGEARHAPLLAESRNVVTGEHR